MTRNNFTVFILSHGRANTIKTVEVLLEQGYTGDWFVVCDNLDEQLAEYKKRFGDKVLVFDKMEYVDKVDTMTNEIHLAAVLYARSASQDFARERGIKYYAQFDDDFTDFSIRYVAEGKLKSKKIADMDRIFELMVEFMEAGDITVTAFGNSGGYFGGKDGPFKKGYSRSTGGTHIFDSTKPINFRGVSQEDFNMAVDYGKIGHVILEILAVSFTTPARSTNEGGMQELYNEVGIDYVNHFYSLMANPSRVKFTQTKDGFKTRVNWNKVHAMIVSDKYKKVAE